MLPSALPVCSRCMSTEQQTCFSAAEWVAIREAVSSACWAAAASQYCTWLSCSASSSCSRFCSSSAQWFPSEQVMTGSACDHDDSPLPVCKPRHSTSHAGPCHARSCSWDHHERLTRLHTDGILHDVLQVQRLHALDGIQVALLLGRLLAHEALCHPCHLCCTLLAELCQRQDLSFQLLGLQSGTEGGQNALHAPWQRPAWVL